MEADILLAGYGGQGLMSLGKAMAKAALKEGKHTTWFPSYGAEMRGGTSHCFLRISGKPIGSPLVEHPDIEIILNQPSLDKFAKKLKRGGILILNSDLSKDDFLRRDVVKVAAPLNKMALECGNIKVANIIALGILISLNQDLMKPATIEEIIKETFSERKDLLEQNLKALSKGQSLSRG